MTKNLNRKIKIMEKMENQELKFSQSLTGLQRSLTVTEERFSELEHRETDGQISMRNSV